MHMITVVFEVLLTALTLPLGRAEADKNALSFEVPIPVETKALPAHFFPEFDSQRVKVNYGLNTVPSMHEDGGMRSVKAQVPLPCSDCLITYMHAGLEYADDSRADASTGMWLHHTVLSTLNKPNRVCPGQRHGDWFFASGNERTPFDLCENGRVKSGYYFDRGDKLTMLTDLMNTLGHSQDVALTITWEYIPSPPGPSIENGFTYLTPYWLDIGGCEVSEKPAKLDSHFHYSMPTKEAKIPGQVKWMGGHLHDGGTRLEVIKNGKVVCSMEAEYETIGLEHHISRISDCSNVGSISIGDEWSITAHYDTTLHKPMMTHDGELEPIMGIVIAYVAENSSDEGNGIEHHHHHHHRHHHHIMVKVCSAIAVVVVLVVFGHLWLSRRGENFMDYIPARLRRSGWIKLGNLNRRSLLGGDQTKTPFITSEPAPAYRDEV